MARSKPPRALSSATAPWIAAILVVSTITAVWIWRARCASEAKGLSAGMVPTYSGLTRHTYLVKESRTMNERRRIADALARVEVSLRTFVRLAEEATPGDPRIRRVRRRWSGSIEGEIETGRGAIAYTKGKAVMRLCVTKAGPHGGIVDHHNSLLYVALHEIAHVACKEYGGHDATFWATFRYILAMAQAVGVYTHVDHAARATTVCGKPLGSSPLTCVVQGSCTVEDATE